MHIFSPWATRAYARRRGPAPFPTAAAATTREAGGRRAMKATSAVPAVRRPRRAPSCPPPVGVPGPRAADVRQRTRPDRIRARPAASGPEVASKVRRRVGPERAGHFGLRAQVEVTAARNARNGVETRTGGRSLSRSDSAPSRVRSRRRSHRRTSAICPRLSAGVGGAPAAVPRAGRLGHPRHRSRGARRDQAGAECPAGGAVPRRQVRKGGKPLADFQRRPEAGGRRAALAPADAAPVRHPPQTAWERGRDLFCRRPGALSRPPGW
jgi:hypothetical protein